MNIFEFRGRLIDDYAAYTGSFIEIRDRRIQRFLKQQLDAGVLWPEPLIQLNPSFETGESRMFRCCKRRLTREYLDWLPNPEEVFDRRSNGYL